MSAMQATPHKELMAQLMNQNVPKSEREHAAVREIERLREHAVILAATAEQVERELCAATVDRLHDLLHRMLEAPTTQISVTWKDAVRQALALGPNQS